MSTSPPATLSQTVAFPVRPADVSHGHRSPGWTEHSPPCATVQSRRIDTSPWCQLSTNQRRRRCKISIKIIHLGCILQIHVLVTSFSIGQQIDGLGVAHTQPLGGGHRLVEALGGGRELPQTVNDLRHLRGGVPESE